MATASSPLNSASCVICNRSPAKPDKTCGSSAYCSKSCQQADWPRHKLLCTEYAAAKTRPSERHRLAILFKADEPKPNLCWVDCELREESGEQPYEVPRMDKILGDDDPHSGHHIVLRNPRRNRDLLNTLEVSFRDSFLMDGLNPNQSILKALGASRPTMPHWRGPVVVMRKQGSGIDPAYYGDITLDDYSNALDYLTIHGDDGVTTPIEGFRRDDTVLGVKLSCYGSWKLYNAKQFVAVEVPNWHPTRATIGGSKPQGEVSPLSELLGFPVRAWKMMPPNHWMDLPEWSHTGSPEDNGPASALFLDVRKGKGTTWGSAPGHWQSGNGDVLLLSANGGDISLGDATALCLFCRHRLEPLIEDVRNEGQPVSNTNKNRILDFMKPKNLTAFKGELASLGTAELDKLMNED